MDSASHYQGTYATAAHRYEQLVRQDANSPWFTLSGLTTHYEYDRDGRLTKRYSPADSVVAHVNQQEFPYAAPPGSSTPTAGLDSVMKGVRLGDTGEPSVVLVYSYDAENRRIRKEYPGAQVVNFLYGEGKQLLTAEFSYLYRGLDEYVYLGGMPVVMLRSRFDWDGTTRVVDWNNWHDWDTEGCLGTSGWGQCGAHLLVHDYLPKPVLTVDSLRRIEGVGEYTPFGQTNKVEWWGEVSPEPVASGTTGLFSGILVPKNGLNLQLRGHFPRWDVRSSAAVGILDENGAWLTYSWGRRYGYGGMGAWTDWVPLTTPTFRVDYYSYTAGWPTPKPQGVSFDGYEYRRYETGAMPYFPPFRFPGQYADVESGLFENWNRFYFPEVGSYGSTDPLLQEPGWLQSEARQGFATPAYAYARGNPLRFSDATGLFTISNDSLENCPNFYIAAKKARDLAGCTQDGKRNVSCMCSNSIQTCTGGCDICSVLGAMMGPELVPDADSDAYTSPSAGSVHVTPQVCQNFSEINELAETMLHEAIHVCEYRSFGAMSHRRWGNRPPSLSCDPYELEFACSSPPWRLGVPLP